MRIVTKNIINNAMLEAGFSQKAVFAAPPMDWNFCVPTRKWLSEFSTNLAVQIKQNFGSFIPETNDCDDFSLFCMSFARLWHRKSQTNGSLPVGVMVYTKRGGERHMSIVAYADFNLVYIEPQNGEFLNLSREEISSCDFVLL